MLLAIYLFIGSMIFISAYTTARNNANGSDKRWIDKSGLILLTLFIHVLIFWPFLLAWVMYDEIKAARNSSDIIGGDENGLY